METPHDTLSLAVDCALQSHACTCTRVSADHSAADNAHGTRPPVNDTRRSRLADPRLQTADAGATRTTVAHRRADWCHPVCILVDGWRRLDSGSSQAARLTRGDWCSACMTSCGANLPCSMAWLLFPSPASAEPNRASGLAVAVETDTVVAAVATPIRQLTLTPDTLSGFVHPARHRLQTPAAVTIAVRRSAHK